MANNNSNTDRLTCNSVKWEVPETRLLLALMREKEVLYKIKLNARNKDIFQDLAEELKLKGYNFTW